MTSTADLGIFIRDMIEDRDDFEVFDWSKDEPTARDPEGAEPFSDRVVAVDASDPNNLIVHCSSDAVFTVRIVRTA